MIQGVDCYTIGLDVGRAVDYSALTVLTRHYRHLKPGEIPSPGVAMTIIYTAVEGYRFPLGTEYEYIAEAVKGVWERFDVQAAKHFCVVDQTGVGAPVVELLRKKQIRSIGVNITAGSSITHPAEDVYNVPKEVLVSSLVTHAQNGHFKIAIEEEEGKELKAQLQNFGYKIHRETGHVTYEALQEKVHDDMVISAALALWWTAYNVYGVKYREGGREPDIQEENEPFRRGR